MKIKNWKAFTCGWICFVILYNLIGHFIHWKPTPNWSWFGFWGVFFVTFFSLIAVFRWIESTSWFQKWSGKRRKKGALLKAIRVWQWMYDHDVFDKEEAYKDLGFEEEWKFCPLCQLYAEKGCGECPLDLPRIGTCRSRIHPYDAWRENQDKETTLRVLNLLKDRLKHITETVVKAQTYTNPI